MLSTFYNLLASLEGLKVKNTFEHINRQLIILLNRSYPVFMKTLLERGNLKNSPFVKSLNFDVFIVPFSGLNLP